jgi:hypothetical protein
MALILPGHMAASNNEVDPDFANVELLATFDGTDGATSAPDLSGNGRTLIFDSLAQLDTAQAKFGMSSLRTDIGGGVDAVRIADSADFNLGTGQYTIEAHVRTTLLADAHQSIISHYDTGSNQRAWWLRMVATTDLLQFWTSGDGTTPNLIVADTVVLAVDTWYHVAVDRDGSNVVRLYKDGVMRDSATDTTDIHDSTAPLLIGANRTSGSNSNAWDGWIDNVRLTVGTARYASDSGFTPPTKPYPTR